MVINSTNINKMNNHLSEITEHKKKHDICRWKSRSWFGTDTTNMAGLNRLMGSQPSHLDYWIPNGNTLYFLINLTY